jgi:hypothetical protein
VTGLAAMLDAGAAITIGIEDAETKPISLEESLLLK